MGILTNLVDNFFKKLQGDLSNEYKEMAKKQWDLDHPPMSEEEIERIKENDEKEQKKQNELKIAKQKLIEEYNDIVQEIKNSKLNNLSK